jgi:DNA-directed RNA polymerase subunit RPC12/RpoP
MDVSLEIHCEACGSANYSLPEGAAEDAPIRCNDCGADQGSVAELRAAMLAQALDRSAESLRRDLDKLDPDDLKD